MFPYGVCWSVSDVKTEREREGAGQRGRGGKKKDVGEDGGRGERHTQGTTEREIEREREKKKEEKMIMAKIFDIILTRE